MESVKQQYLTLKEGKMTQEQFMRNVRMSLPQYITNLSSFNDTVKILKNKGILTEADVKEGIGMFHDPIGYRKSEPNPKDKIFTKKFVGTSDTPGHTGYIYDIYKNGVKVKTIEGEGNANAWINDEMRKLNDDEEDKDDWSKMDKDDVYPAGFPGMTEKLNEANTKSPLIINGKKVASYTQNGDKSYSIEYTDGTKDKIYVNHEEWDVINDFHHQDKIDEADIYGIAGNPEEEEMAKATRVPRRKIPSKKDEEDELDAILKQLDDEEDAKHVMGDKSDFELKESKTPTGKSLYDHFSEIDNLNGHEVTQGIDWEMQNNPELTKLEAQKIVIKKLKKNPLYYTAWDMSGVEGYEPEYISKDTKPEWMAMKPVKGNDLVDKNRGMKPVKGVEKIKASSNKANKETNKAEDMTLMSLVASTLRGVPKMQAQGEKVKIIRIKEAVAKLVREIIQENKNK